MSLIICCSCDEHYGGDALACAKEIASGTTTPCACDCHRSKPLNEFFADANKECARIFEKALREIVKLGVFSRWKAKRIAQKALGTGPYWKDGVE